MSRVVTTNKQAIPTVFETTMRPRWYWDITNHRFHHQRYKPGQLRPTSTKSLNTIMLTMKEVRSFLTVQMLSQIQNACRVRGRTKHHEWVLTPNKDQNTTAGRLTGPRRGGKVAQHQLPGTSRGGRREVGEGK